jgi:hypothetical protein
LSKAGLSIANWQILASLEVMKLFLVLTLGLFSSFLATAQDSQPSASFVAAIEELFELSNQSEQYEIALVAGFETGLGNAAANMPAELKPKMDRAMAKVKEYMLKEMGWDKVKPDMIKLYSEHFNEEEIRSVIPLFQNPKMKSFVTKQMKLLPDSMQIGASKAAALQPQIMKIVQEEMSK